LPILQTFCQKAREILEIQAFWQKFGQEKCNKSPIFQTFCHHAKIQAKVRKFFEIFAKNCQFYTLFAKKRVNFFEIQGFWQKFGQEKCNKRPISQTF